MHDDDEMSGEVWYSVGKHDVFPEQFGPFLLGDLRIKAAMLKHHADLFTYEFWQGRKERIQQGVMEDVFPYPQAIRFSYRYAQREAARRRARGLSASAPR
jgi:isocitrate dehydrogenase kinase/phosphatase